MGEHDQPNPHVEAGWYAVDAHTQRYWDGEMWTTHVAPLPSSAPRSTATPSDNERLYATVLHLSAFVFPILGAAIMWLIKREDSPFIDAHGKAATNFAITMLLASIGSVMLIFLLVDVFVLIGVLLLLVLCVIGVVLPIVAAVQANKGEAYTYPGAIPIFA